LGAESEGASSTEGILRDITGRVNNAGSNPVSARGLGLGQRRQSHCSYVNMKTVERGINTTPYQKESILEETDVDV